MGSCNFGEGSPDGRILALNLEVLEDDRNFFPNYNVTMVLRARPSRRNPQIAGLAAYEWLKNGGFVTDK